MQKNAWLYKTKNLTKNMHDVNMYGFTKPDLHLKQTKTKNTPHIN